jgi:hypothetical protein
VGMGREDTRNSRDRFVTYFMIPWACTADSHPTSV